MKLNELKQIYRQAAEKMLHEQSYEKDGIQFADVKGELDEKYTAKLGKYGILAMIWRNPG